MDELELTAHEFNLIQTGLYENLICNSRQEWRIFSDFRLRSIGPSACWFMNHDRLLRSHTETNRSDFRNAFRKQNYRA